MYEQIIVGVGLALLLVLCLPFAGIQKLVLEVYSWVLRLALLALFGSGVYLWFRPDQLPGEVTDALSNFPWLRAVLPAPGMQHFGICAAALGVAVLLPLLVVLDVCRKLAGERLRRLRALAAGPAAEASLSPAPAPQHGPSPAPRRIDRRAAADTMAEAASRQPLRVANRLRQ